VYLVYQKRASHVAVEHHGEEGGDFLRLGLKRFMRNPEGLLLVSELFFWRLAITKFNPSERFLCREKKEKDSQHTRIYIGADEIRKYIGEEEWAANDEREGGSQK